MEVWVSIASFLIPCCSLAGLACLAFIFTLGNTWKNSNGQYDYIRGEVVSLRKDTLDSAKCYLVVKYEHSELNYECEISEPIFINDVRSLVGDSIDLKVLKDNPKSVYVYGAFGLEKLIQSLIRSCTQCLVFCIVIVLLSAFIVAFFYYLNL